MTILILACAALAIAALLTWTSLRSTRAALLAAQANGLQLLQELEKASATEARRAAELQKAKAEARESKDELRALKKKRFDDKKPAQPSAVIDDNSIELDRAWRRAEEEKNVLQARVHTLELALAEAKAVKPVTPPPPPKVEAAPAKAEPEIDPKQHAELRRKNEWYRRIHLVQQKELELERDKTAHVRKRFLDVCREVVTLEKIVGKVELERMKTEQSAYQATQQDEEARS